MCGAHRLGEQLHEAFPELDGKPLDFWPNTITMQRKSTGLPPSLSDFPDTESWKRAMNAFQDYRPLPPLEPVVGKPETFEDLGITDGVLGPASGDWVVVVDDESDAFVGARSAADIMQFERVFGNGRDEAKDILDNWKPVRTPDPPWLGATWLPAVLEHVLGPDVTAELLTDEGRWLAELAKEFETRGVAINRTQRLQVRRIADGRWQATLKGTVEVHCERGKIHPDQRINWTDFSDNGAAWTDTLKAAHNGDLESARSVAHWLRVNWGKAWSDPCDRQEKRRIKRR